jgi:hypothetical protein
MEAINWESVRWDWPDYIVVRPAPDLPPGFLPESLDGRWFDTSHLHMATSAEALALAGGAVAVPTGRLEQRDDGACAEVYEVRPRR